MSRLRIVLPMARLAALLAVLLAGTATAKLPPLSEQDKQDNLQKSAKAAYNDKIDAYKLCQAQDRVAAAYRNSPQAAARPVPVTTMTLPVAIPPCAEPGPFEVTTVAQKPLEASGAHSPPETAKSPPSTSTPSGDPSQAPKR